MKDYDADRPRPTRDLQAQTADRLREFLTHLQNQDVAGVEAMLANDVRSLSDGGGEFHAARQPVIGRKNVARLLLGLSAKGAREGQMSFRMLNGLPAVVVDLPRRHGAFAPRFTFQIELDRAGGIIAVHTVLASRKLVAVTGEAQ
jgi:RNA polymerase sigma-70 factor (ECF subfamily)